MRGRAIPDFEWSLIDKVSNSAAGVIVSGAYRVLALLAAIPWNQLLPFELERLEEHYEVEDALYLKDTETRDGVDRLSHFQLPPHS